MLYLTCISVPCADICHKYSKNEFKNIPLLGKSLKDRYVNRFCFTCMDPRPSTPTKTPKKATMVWLTVQCTLTVGQFITILWTIYEYLRL